MRDCVSVRQHSWHECKRSKHTVSLGTLELIHCPHCLLLLIQYCLNQTMRNRLTAIYFIFNSNIEMSDLCTRPRSTIPGSILAFLSLCSKNLFITSHLWKKYFVSLLQNHSICKPELLLLKLHIISPFFLALSRASVRFLWVSVSVNCFPQHWWQVSWQAI